MRAEILEKLAALITAAFGLVCTGLEMAIQAIFREVFGEASDIVAMIVYAVIVTIIAVIATILIARAARRAKIKIDE